MGCEDGGMREVEGAGYGGRWEGMGYEGGGRVWGMREVGGMKRRMLLKCSTCSLAH